MNGITDRFLLAIGIAMLVYELVVLALGKFVNEKILSALISPRILKAAKQYPVISVGIGVILGHLFWPQVVELQCP